MSTSGTCCQESAMAPREDQPDPLYVVYDGDRIVVALDMPAVHGGVEDSASGVVEVARLVACPAGDGSQLQDSTISDEPPGLGGAKAWYGLGAVVGLCAGIVVSEAVSKGLGLPLMLVTAVALAVGYRRRKRVVAEAWRRRHRVLWHAEDTRAFTTALQACEQVIDAWPSIGPMVGVADAGPVLARSLWTLSEVLVSRGALREQRDELEQARTDLPAATKVWHEIDDRVERLDGSLAAFDAEVDARVAAVADLAEGCQRYVREELAISRAREAVRRADQALGEALTPVGGALEPGHELADRTAAVLDAYRELTRDQPPLV
jgi:hypothetical protein